MLQCCGEIFNTAIKVVAIGTIVYSSTSLLFDCSQLEIVSSVKKLSINAGVKNVSPCTHSRRLADEFCCCCCVSLCQHEHIIPLHHWHLILQHTVKGRRHVGIISINRERQGEKKKESEREELLHVCRERHTNNKKTRQ